MEEKKYVEPQQIEEEYDEIDIMELLRKLFKEWKLILKWCGIAAVVGIVIAFSLPKEYTVNSKLAPESASKSGGGSLGSLASLAGISLGSVSGADAVYPDLYPDIISSTPFVVELFPVQVDFTAKKQEMKADYYTYLKEYTHGPWWGKVIGFPM
ncbi:MAG: chain-length determining protein, partial [Bacteroidales bacterium]|nr:chain-length determining protein [Bacteroidales bacterium]